MAKLVNKVGRGVIAAAMFTAATSCTHPSAREHARIMHLAEIQLHAGINKVEMLAPDGRAGMIVVATVLNDGHDALTPTSTAYFVMLPDDNGTGWNLLVAGGPDTELRTDGVISTVRFAKGFVDGNPETLEFIAVKEGGQANHGPGPYFIRTFRLVTGLKGGDPNGFEQLSETKTTVNYSTPDAAIQGEIGLP